VFVLSLPLRPIWMFFLALGFFWFFARGCCPDLFFSPMIFSCSGQSGPPAFGNGLLFVCLGGGLQVAASATACVRFA